MREFPSVEQVLIHLIHSVTLKTFVPLLLPIGVDLFLGALLTELSVYSWVDCWHPFFPGSQTSSYSTVVGDQQKRGCQLNATLISPGSVTKVYLQ